MAIVVAQVTIDDLIQAIDSREKKRTAAIIVALRDFWPADADDVKCQLAQKRLSAARWFDLAVDWGALLMQHFTETPGMRQRYAQALIECGHFATARAELELLVAHPGVRKGQKAECLGSIGRTYKQQFVNAKLETDRVDMESFDLAVSSYLRGFGLDEEANSWHGINVVALRMLAMRRQWAVEGDPRQMASDIVETLLLAPAGRTHWDEATLAEACVALGRWEEAAKYLRAYLWHPQIDAFSVAATLRQFKEIWEFGAPASSGRRDDHGEELVTLLRARLIEIEDGCVRLQASDIKATLSKPDVRYEKVFGNDHFTTLSNFRTGLDRCGPVARIGLDIDRGDGTGFLMRGSDLHPSLGPDPVLVTNAHVIDPTARRLNGGLSPSDVKITFQTLPDVSPTDVFAVSKVLWSSDREALDATIVRLDPTPPLKMPYPIALTMPAKSSRVIAIGHPGGGTLSLSLNDNELIDFEEPGSRVHYRTPTEGGNSGCPVFTKDWKLLALHHAGGDGMPKLNGNSGTYQANEGISILAIREALARVASFP